MRIIVTGASAGIGRGIATELARGGHAIGALARTESTLESLRAEITEAGGRCEIAIADLRDHESATAAIDGLIERLEGLDSLVNNAGLVIRKDAMSITLEEWHAMVETNVNGPFYATRAVLPTFIEQGRGHIVNVSSISGYYPLKGGSGYAATKYANTGFSESLFQEVREHGIKVTTVFPGSVDSASHRHADDDGSWKVRPTEVGEAIRSLLETRDANVISRLEIRPLGKPPTR